MQMTYSYLECFVSFASHIDAIRYHHCIYSFQMKKQNLGFIDKT